MALRIRRGLSSDRTSITPEQGEFLYTTDTYQVYIGDGVTAGGRPLYTLTSLGAIGLTDLSASSPLSYNNTTGAFSIQIASSTQSGYLSNTNWITFNNKQNALTLTNIGTSGAATLIGSTLNIPIYGSGGGGSGSVTNVSVVTANGFAGTVATSTTTPAITLSTTITGLLKGDGTSISAATAGTDYQSALTGTGLVLSTGGTISYITNNSTNWNTAYTNRITSLTTTGSSGAATLISNVLNIPEYTAAGLGAIATTRTISTTTPLQGGGDLSADRTLSILQASSTQDGYLSSANWVTFNGKQNALSGTGIVKSTAGTISYLTDNSSNWDTAFGWGNHASAGYLLASTAATTYTPQSRTLTINSTTYDLSANRSWTIATGATNLDGLSDVVLTTPVTGDLLQYNISNQWVNVPLSSLTSVGAGNGLSISTGNVILGGTLDLNTTINTYKTSTASQYSLSFISGSTAFTSPGTAPIGITETTSYSAGRAAFYVGATDNHGAIVEGRGIPTLTAPTILYKFTITSATVTLGGVYTNNGQNFTILEAVTGTTIFAYSTGTPTNTGTLVQISGSGTATITFSRYQIIQSAFNRTTADLIKNASLFAKSKQGIGLYVCSQPNETFTHYTEYIAPKIPATLIEKTTGVRTFEAFGNTTYNLLALRLTDDSGAPTYTRQGVSMTFESTISRTSTGLSFVETLSELLAYSTATGVGGSSFDIRTKNTNKELTTNIRIDGESNKISLPSYLAISPPILFTVGGTGNITAMRALFPNNPPPFTGVYSYENRDFYAITISTAISGGGAGFVGTPVIGWRVARIQITNPGSGYITPPAITVSGGTLFTTTSIAGTFVNGGTALSATATLTSGRVTSISFTGGTRYTVPPIVTIAPPPSGVTATADVIIETGEFLTATITSAGANYSTVRDSIYVIDTRNDVSNDNTQIGTLLALNASGELVKSNNLLSLDYILNSRTANPTSAIYGSGGVLLTPATINATAGLNIDGTTLALSSSTTNITSTNINIGGTTGIINSSSLTISPGTLTLNAGAGGLAGTVTGVTNINYSGGYTINSSLNTGAISAIGDLTLSAISNATPGGERLRLNSAEFVYIFDKLTTGLTGGEVFTMVDPVNGQVGYTTLATVATTNDYNDLSNLPVLSTVATSNDYNDLDNLPILALVATSGSYADLSGTPTIPTTLDSLTNVNAPSPTNGQVLSYNSGVSEWQAVTFSASGLTLQTNTFTNANQSTLNLQQGTNITIVDSGTGTVTINSTGGSGGVGLDTVFMLMGA